MGFCYFRFANNTSQNYFKQTCPSKPTHIFRYSFQCVISVFYEFVCKRYTVLFILLKIFCTGGFVLAIFQNFIFGRNVQKQEEELLVFTLCYSKAYTQFTNYLVVRRSII